MCGVGRVRFFNYCQHFPVIRCQLYTFGDLSGGGFHSQAFGVSADGSVVVGVSESASGGQAFRWTSGGGMIGLGDLPGGGFQSTAYDVSGDGSLVVGDSWSVSGGLEALFGIT